MILSIPRGYPLPLGRYRRGVLLGDAEVVAELLDLFEGTIASIGVVACLCCRNYSRRWCISRAAQGAKKYVVTAYAFVLWMLGERKRSVAVESHVGVSRFEGIAYP